MLPALQNAAAKAERVLTEIKADIKADFGRPQSPEDGTWSDGRYIHGKRIYSLSGIPIPCTLRTSVYNVNYHLIIILDFCHSSLELLRLCVKIEAFWFLFAESEFQAEFPWSAKNDGEKRHESEFKRRILDLSKVSKRGSGLGNRLFELIWKIVLTEMQLVSRVLLRRFAWDEDE